MCLEDKGLKTSCLEKKAQNTYTPAKFHSSPPKNDGSKTILSFWGPANFQGFSLLNFQGVGPVGPGSS